MIPQRQKVMCDKHRPVNLPKEPPWVGKINGFIWKTGWGDGSGNPGKQGGKCRRWYPGGNTARGATSNVGVELGPSSTLAGLSSLEIHGCFSIVSSDKFKIFLIENELLLGENSAMLGGEYAIPLVAIMGFAQGHM